MTLEQLFPGNIGRMRLTRVILRLKRPDLRDLDPTAPLQAELLSLLRQTLKDLEAA